MATFKRYRDSNGDLLWGALIDESSQRENKWKSGAKVNVLKRNGKQKTVTLDYIVKHDASGWLWAIVGGAKAKRGKYVPLDGKCGQCGKAIPAKYPLCLDCKETSRDDRERGPAKARCAAAGCNNIALGGSTNLCLPCYQGIKPAEHEQPASDMSDASDGPFPAW